MNKQISPDDFTWMIAKSILKLQPEIELTVSGPLRLIVDHCGFDLTPLYHMNGTSEAEHLEFVVAGVVRDILWRKTAPKTPSASQKTLTPHIKPISVFDRVSREMVTHLPFVNDTVILFMMDLGSSYVALEEDTRREWGLTVDEVNDIAVHNLHESKRRQVVGRLYSNANNHRMVVFDDSDGLTASRILLPDFHSSLRPMLGQDFYVGIPTRDYLVAFTMGAVGSGLETVVSEHYKTKPFPISDRLFLATRDGIAGSAA